MGLRPALAERERPGCQICLRARLILTLMEATRPPGPAALTLSVTGSSLLLVRRSARARGDPGAQHAADLALPVLMVRPEPRQNVGIHGQRLLGAVAAGPILRAGRAGVRCGGLRRGRLRIAEQPLKKLIVVKVVGVLVRF